MNYLALAIVLMAIVTYIPRALPLVIFRKKIQSDFIKSFLYYLPFAVLGAMTFPSILSSTGSIVSAAAGFVAALILAFFERGLLRVALGAVAIVFAFEAMLLIM